MGDRLRAWSTAVGTPEEIADGCRTARSGIPYVRKRGGSLDVAVEAVRIFEDDERFNAGSGSVSELTEGLSRWTRL
jgi:isoaspartyl peptidase/L-asparaginase-like protein (Ntn-hydrolase superfamily)